LAGGPDALLALQSGVISMALPFTFVLILAVFSLFYGMLIEVNFFNIESKSVDNKEL
jgi:choline-glycine betaine transporter